jgi:hypothetical protein
VTCPARLTAACRVAWHPSDPQLIASASADGTVCGFRPDGSEAFCLKHGSGVSGCAFSTLQPDLLATTTEAGSVYVWRMAPPLEEEGREMRCALVCTLAGHRHVGRGRPVPARVRQVQLAGPSACPRRPRPSRRCRIVMHLLDRRAHLQAAGLQRQLVAAGARAAAQRV